MMVCAALLLVVTACLGAPENLALNRPYTLTPAPNYSPCIDPGDATQLTDGVRTAGHFWTRPSTVGWSGVSLRMITIDLGQVQPIAGASFSTAAGVADVGWPESIALMVSEDNQTYHLLGDLVQLTDGGAPPAEGGYRTFTYQTTALSSRGRYVRLAVQAGGQYLFVDEIEVFKGAPEAAAQPAAGIRLPGDNFLFAMRYVRRQELDRVALRGRIESSTVAAEIRQKLLAELTEAGEALRRPESVADPASFRAIPPYDEPHRRLFALHGKLLAAEGQPPLAIWHKYRYAPLGLFEPPAAGPPRLAARLLRGEHRAEVLCLTNATAEPTSVQVRVEGLPGGPAGAGLEVRQVEFVDTRENKLVAAALPALPADDGWYTTDIAAGMTRQLWLGLHPSVAGRATARVIIRQGQQTREVPFEVDIVPRELPPTELVCGLWDYADQPAYGLTPGNRERAIADMKAHHVNLAHGLRALAAVPPADGVDAAGNLTKPLDFTRFDAWLKLWEGARYYQIYLGVVPSSTFAGLKPGTPAFTQAVGQWAAAWDKKAVEAGLTGGRLQFAFLDEPNTAEQYAISRLWTEAFKAGSKEIAVFCDPQFFNPEAQAALPAAMETWDIICPLLFQYNTTAAMKAAVDAEVAEGKQLWFYQAHGPNRLFDPAYFRLQPWYCYRWGAVGQGFWAYGDTGGVASSWNEYVATKGVSYCLPYIDAEQITPSKHWEAFREGIEDYQLLRLLATCGASGQAAARRLAEELTTTTEAVTRQDLRILWQEATPCATADEVRLKIYDELARAEGR